MAFTLDGDSGDKSHLVWTVSIDEDFVDTVDTHLPQGLSFSRDFRSDRTAAVLSDRKSREIAADVGDFGFADGSSREGESYAGVAV